MKDLIFSVEFWVAMAVAVALKLRSSPSISIGAAAITTITAVGAALVFTHPIETYLRLPDRSYTAAIAALVALSAEHVARQALNLNLTELIRAWRGK